MNIVANPLQPLIDVAEALLLFLHDDLGFGWGAAIVGLTFITRLVILPLSMKSIRSMRVLQAHAPEMKAIQEKYKNDPQRRQRELMEFYRSNKINPLASCWPILLQLPVFLSLFYLLRSDAFAADVESDPPVGWLIVDDLTVKATGVVLVVLIALFIVTQLGAGLVMAVRPQGAQRVMMLALPFVFAPFIISFPAGLVVYWITTNIWTLGQQAVVTRLIPAPDQTEAAEVTAAAKKAPPPPPRKKKRRR